ncbi:hypothetical protein AB1K42_15390 [Roseibium algicola]|uniref:hypothetical protein n=1 Tax=Roseibium algicola TaxID=2857014 RepID=UPI0034592B42
MLMKPMETAPKDGKEVILEVESRAGRPGKFLVGHYMPGGHCIEDHPPIKEGWYFWNGCSFDIASKPIGWCDLPIEDTSPPEDVSIDDLVAVGEKVIEMAERIKPVHKVMPGAQAAWSFEDENTRFNVTVTVSDPDPATAAAP